MKKMELLNHLVFFNLLKSLQKVRYLRNFVEILYLMFFYTCIVGSRSKCKERATQFSKNTGSEEVEILPMNNEKGEEFYDDDVNINKNDYNNGDADYLPPTTGQLRTFTINSLFFF